MNHMIYHVTYKSRDSYACFLPLFTFKTVFIQKKIQILYFLSSHAFVKDGSSNLNNQKKIKK